MQTDEVFPVASPRSSEAQRLLAETIGRWADQEILAHRSDWHGADDAELYRPAMDRLFDLLGGARGVDELLDDGDAEARQAASSSTALLEQVGRADCGVGLIIANTLVLRAGCLEALDGEAWSRLCGDAAGGGLALGALVLADYGRASGQAEALPRPKLLAGLQPQAWVSPVEGGWTVEGASVRPQCAGTQAALFGVLCGVRGGDSDLALALVPANAAGLTRSAEPLKLTGLGASANVDIALQQVFVPASQLVPIDATAYGALLARYQLACAALCTGAMLGAWGILVDWTEDRVIKGRGQLLRENPLAAALMGDIGGRIGTARLLVFQLAALIDQRGAADAAIRATAAAVWRTVSRGATRALDRTMELMGSAGYACEWNLERYWRGVKTITIGVAPETVGPVQMARHYFGCETL